MAVEIKESNVGKATLYQRHGKELKKYLLMHMFHFLKILKKNKNLIFNYMQKNITFPFLLFYFDSNLFKL